MDNFLVELQQEDSNAIFVCPRHNTACVQRTVVKRSANHGRNFHTCVVHGCDFFLWASDLKTATSLYQERHGQQANRPFKNRVVVELQQPYKCTHPDDGAQSPTLPAMFCGTSIQLDQNS